MSEYSLVSRALLRRRFGFDVVVAERDSALYKTYVEFFSRVREAPELRKDCCGCAYEQDQCHPDPDGGGTGANE